MAIAYNPKIVSTGLVLCLDAANPKSYAGIGTTWTDLVGKRNGNIFNGPTYNSAGYFTFDGIDDYIDISTNSNEMYWTPTGAYGMTHMTIEMWVKSSDTGGRLYTKPWNGGGQYNIFIHTGLFELFSGGTNTTSISFGRNVCNGTWTQIICWASPTQIGYSINATEFSGSANHTLSYTTPSSGVNQISVGLMTLYPYGSGWAGNTGFSIQGDMAVTRVYSSVLSAAEILQNYNATRSRFGL